MFSSITYSINWWNNIPFPAWNFKIPLHDGEENSIQYLSASVFE